MLQYSCPRATISDENPLAIWNAIRENVVEIINTKQIKNVVSNFIDIVVPVDGSTAFIDIAVPVDGSTAFIDIAVPVDGSTAFIDIAVPVDGSTALTPLSGTVVTKSL